MSTSSGVPRKAFSSLAAIENANTSRLPISDYDYGDDYGQRSLPA
jgi:hypothetical protein